MRLTAPVKYRGLRLGSYQDQRRSPSARVPAVMLHTRLGVFGVSVDSSNIKLVGQRLPRHLWVLCSVYCCRQKGSYITTEISCALTLQPTLQSCCEFEPSDTVHISSCYDVAALFQKVTEFRRVWPRTKPFPLRVGVVYIPALQQIIFNADIKVDQHRSYHPLEN